ncbi:MAG TPA: hypothetical protein ACFYEF_04395, partial [Candidatus Wunengus sp. YC63]|uniref:hypothetical protein n=2 Tax=unclassified Candidatus Wunengus TaxID=3367695 RepID=UPI004027DA81
LDKNTRPVEPAKIPPPHRPMNTWKHMVAYLCIWFLVAVLVMVYFTSTGSPQAGLLEVGVSALIFVILFHLVMKFFPFVSKIITSVLVIGFGIALIYVNYHFLRVVKKDAHLEELLVGDLLVKKIMKTIKKEPIAVAVKEKIPKAVPKPEYEKPPPAMILEQLKMSIADPTRSEIAFSYITALSPAIKAGTTLMAEKYKTETIVSTMRTEVSGLEFATKGCELLPLESTDSRELTLLPPLNFIHEVPVMTFEKPRLQSPISEMNTFIQFIKLHGPIKDNRIPIN